MMAKSCNCYTSPQLVGDTEKTQYQLCLENILPECPSNAMSIITDIFGMVTNPNTVTTAGFVLDTINLNTPPPAPPIGGDTQAMTAWCQNPKAQGHTQFQDLCTKSVFSDSYSPKSDDDEDTKKILGLDWYWIVLIVVAIILLIVVIVKMARK